MLNYQLAMMIAYSLLGFGIFGLVVDGLGTLIVPSYLDSQKNMAFLIAEPFLIAAGIFILRRYKIKIKKIRA